MEKKKVRSKKIAGEDVKRRKDGGKSEDGE